MFGRPESDDHPGVVALPPLIFAGFLVAGILLTWALPAFLPSAYTTWMLALGGFFVAAAVVLAIGGILAFTKAGTNIEPTKPALVLVFDGPYRFTRNPMYSGLILMLVGISLLFSIDYALVLAMPFAAVLHYGVVLREEAYLTAKFGEPYQNYLTQTRRWI
ncbi:MAG: isoprenylcysteine carboxylmethyltransferase family protein [Pseudomonadota bacterium]